MCVRVEYTRSERASASDARSRVGEERDHLIHQRVDRVFFLYSGRKIVASAISSYFVLCALYYSPISSSTPLERRSSYTRAQSSVGVRARLFFLDLSHSTSLGYICFTLRVLCVTYIITTIRTCRCGACVARVS